MVRYKYFGPATKYVGKTLWEIVGNLKNFGVGRLIVKSTTLKFPEPSFFKILQIQPLVEPQNKNHNRNVIAWIEEVYRGKKIETILEIQDNHYPNFMLVPKLEEEKYYKLEEKYRNIETKQSIPQYVKCPPLIKVLYNRRKDFYEESFPHIKTVLSDSVYCDYRLEEGEAETPKQYCNLYRGKISVDENIKEIVRLQKIVNSYKLKECAKK